MAKPISSGKFETKVESRQIRLETEKQQAILHADNYNIVLLVDFKNLYKFTHYFYQKISKNTYEHFAIY